MKSIINFFFKKRWIPGTAKFVLCGQHPKATGTISINKLAKTEIKLEKDVRNYLINFFSK